jgi:hypothetical protein
VTIVFNGIALALGQNAHSAWQRSALAALAIQIVLTIELTQDACDVGKA